MIRALFLISLFAVWMVFYQTHTQNPGEVTLQFSGFEIKTSALFLFTVLLFLVLLTFYWGQIWHFLANFPKQLREGYHSRKLKEGLDALYNGFDALAAGDGLTAKKFAKRTQNLLPDGRLSNMLQAEVASLSGNEDVASLRFQELAEDEETAFIGLKGLLSQFYRRGQYLQALDVAQKAYKLKPKSTWVLEMLIEIYMHIGKFSEALNLLPQAKSHNVYTEDQLKLFECALRLQKAHSCQKEEPKEALKQIEKGLKTLRSFVPLVLLQAKILEKENEVDKAEKALANFWRESAHPDVMQAWLFLVKTHHQDKLLKKAVALTKPLVNEPHGAMALAKIYLNEKELEKARELLVSALRLEKNKEGYTLLSVLDDELKGGSSGYKWLKKAQNHNNLESLSHGYVEQYEAWRRQYILNEDVSTLSTTLEQPTTLLEG